MRFGRWTHTVHVVILCILLAAEMPLVVLAGTNKKSTNTNAVIEEGEKNKKEAEKQKNELKNGLTNVKAVLASLEESKNNLEAYVEELDNDLKAIEAKIDDFNKLIAEIEAEIADTMILADEARAREEEQYELMKKRIKFMYEKGNASYAEMLFNSASFVEFLNKADYINKLSAYDKKMLDDYIETKEEVEMYEAELRQQDVELEEAKAAAENEQNAMEVLIEAKEEEITAYESDISSQEEAIAEYEAMIAEQNQIIKDLEAAIAAERKRLEEENRVALTYDGGMFKWPAPSYTRISDDFGNRMHPTLKVEKFHNGLDMAAPSGSPILAAYDGNVIAASYSSTMGNYAMIDHGDGLITIYMHASSISVSTGQMVKKGQQIGAVGSTGRSTGPHLHFGVRLNGEYVSPWRYLGK